MATIRSMFAPVRCLFASVRPTVNVEARTSSATAGSRTPIIAEGAMTKAAFSTTAARPARKNLRQKKDQRIGIIRYHLTHPLTPRPLRLSRLRSLRHWTIHRAWQLFQATRRAATQATLERQWNAMREACEALRNTGEDGLSVSGVGAGIEKKLGGGGGKVAGVAMHEVEAAARGQKEVGKLYRVAMMKGGVWDRVPIEYARAQTETPARAGWDHGWTR